MGISASRTRINQTSSNIVKLTNKADQTCIVSSSKNISDITLTFENADIGNISFVQASVVDANCVFQSNIQLISEGLFEQIQQVKNASTVGILPINPLGFDLDLTTINTSQDMEVALTNNIYQICNFNVEDNIENVTINAVGSSIDNISFQQAGNLQGECILTNLAKLESQINVQQAADVSNGGRKTIFTVLIIGIIVIGIIVGLTLIFSSLSKRKNKGETDVNLCEKLTGAEKANCEIEQKKAKSTESGQTSSNKTNTSSGIDINQLLQLAKAYDSIN